MRPTEWLLSVFFVAVIAVKLAEGTWQLESWPLTHVPMFAGYVPPELTPYRATLLGTRGGPWFELTAADFLLGEDEYVRRLPREPTLLASRCAELGRLYNAERLPALRLTALRARLERVRRPGVPSPPFDQVVPCRLEPSHQP